MPLTLDRAKPAVPFGGIYRLIDFALSNLANSGYRKIAVLTQYKSHSLDRHISMTWRMSRLLGNWVAPVPAQMRKGPHWFSGSADAIYQNLNLIHDEKPDYVIVFGSDHIYRMDPSQMVQAHIDSGAGVTVAGIRVPIDQATAFGVIEADATGLIKEFHEKPEHPSPTHDDPTSAFVSMGNYVFSADLLEEIISVDAENPDSRNDMGGDIIPGLVGRDEAYVYDFQSNDIPGQHERERGYWRDVGTVDAYYDANMDILEVDPIFSLYNDEWPIYTNQPPVPPAKFIFDEDGRRGMAINSIVSAGTIISGSSVHRSVISPNVRLHSYSSVEDSVIMHGVSVGRNAQIKRAILDKDVVVEPGAKIGFDAEHDAARFTVTDSGIIVVAKGEVVKAD